MKHGTMKQENNENDVSEVVKSFRRVKRMKFAKTAKRGTTLFLMLLATGMATGCASSGQESGISHS